MLLARHHQLGKNPRRFKSYRELRVATRTPTEFSKTHFFDLSDPVPSCQVKYNFGQNAEDRRDRSVSGLVTNRLRVRRPEKAKPWSAF